ncbi:MAG: hemerythrin domain-containing protein [Candidatus Krumholzibacteriia bacterium]
MDLLELLKKEHDEVRANLQKFSELKEDPDGNGRELQRIFTRLKSDLEAHMAGEERVFYPRLKDTEESRSEAMEAIEEHHVVKLLLREIGSIQMGEKWVAKMSVLKENVEHHAEEEEEEVFPISRKLFSEADLDRMAREFKQEKKASGH